MKSNRFFRMLFLSFLIIILVYTVGVTGVYFFKNDQLNDLERRNNHKMMLVQVQKSMDQRIQTALNEVIQLQSSDGYKLFVKNNEEHLKHYYIMQVYNELQRNITAYANYDFNIGVMRNEDNIVITPKKTIEKQSYYNEIGLDEKSIKELEEYIRDDNWSSRFKLYPLVTKTKEDQLAFVKKDRNVNGEVVLFFLSFNNNNPLPLQENPLNKDGIAMVSENQILMMDSKFEKQTIESILSPKNLDLIRKENDPVSSYFTLDISNQTIHSMGSSIVGDWTYLYIVPANITQPFPQSDILRPIFILLILIMLGILLTLLLANYTYRPVKKIVNILKEGQDIDTGDEFTFIHNKTLKIRTLNKHLQNTVEQSKLSLKVKFLRELLFGLVPRNTISDHVKNFNLEVLEDGFTLILLGYRRFSDLNENLSRDGIHKLIMQTISFLEESLPSHIKCEIFELESEKLVIIMKESKLENVKLQLSHFIEQLQEGFRTNIVMAIANPSFSVFELEQSYKEARNLLEYQFILDKHTILTLEDIAHLKNEPYFYPLDFEADLINLLMRGKKEKAFVMLKNILQDNLNERNLNKGTLSQFIFAIAATVNRILQNVNKPKLNFSLNENKLYLNLLDFNDKRELEKKIYDIFNEVFEEIHSSKENENTTVGNELVNYIYLNYQTDISLNDLADYFQLSPSYISTIFKTQTGENFKDFLNRYRIQKAKEILSSSNIKVNEVASIVGYNNVNTFIRLFKKYVGLSPGQYEKNI